MSGNAMTYEKSSQVFNTLPLLSGVACAIFYARMMPLLSIDCSSWDDWAEGWLSGKDRTVNTAVDAARLNYTRSEHIPSLKPRVWSAWAAGYLAEHKYTDAATWTNYTVFKSDVASASLVHRILTTHFVCPHCYKQPDQHTKSGKCIFGAHTWKGINDAWSP